MDNETRIREAKQFVHLRLERCMTAREAAELMKRPVSTLWNWVKRWCPESAKEITDRSDPPPGMGNITDLEEAQKRRAALPEKKREKALAILIFRKGLETLIQEKDEKLRIMG